MLRDSLAQMLEVMTKVLGDRTDPRTAARDLAYLTVHGKERANQITYSLEDLILEFHIRTSARNGSTSPVSSEVSAAMIDASVISAEEQATFWGAPYGTIVHAWCSWRHY